MVEECLMLSPVVLGAIVAPENARCIYKSSATPLEDTINENIGKVTVSLIEKWNIVVFIPY